jgi:hypothetical protein
MLTHKKVNERVSLYIPKRIYEEIDTKRVDIPRSKFILRILEDYLVGDVEP